ncbi:hypothetical protein PENTCL1PPCAC_18300, partial [Pristionchus entomophagus]
FLHSSVLLIERDSTQSMSPSLLPLLLLVSSAAALFEDAPLPAAAASQTPDNLRQKIVEMCNFPSENMTPDQYTLCTQLVAIFRVQLLNEQRVDHEKEGDSVSLEKRKASFIRFGKRSVPIEEYEERESVPEKRKASFIRFGRR